MKTGDLSVQKTPTATDDAVTKAYADSKAPFTSGCRVWRDGNQSLANDVYTKVAFNVENYDTLGEFDKDTNYRFTATIAGKYSVTTGVTFAAGSGGNCNVYIKVNGEFSNGSGCCGSTLHHKVVVTDTVTLAANDYVEIWVNHNSTGVINLMGNTYGTWLTVQRIA